MLAAWSCQPESSPHLLGLRPRICRFGPTCGSRGLPRPTAPCSACGSCTPVASATTRSPYAGGARLRPLRAPAPGDQRPRDVPPASRRHPLPPRDPRDLSGPHTARPRRHPRPQATPPCGAAGAGARHDGELAREDDAERQALLEAHGERVLRVSWKQAVWVSRRPCVASTGRALLAPSPQFLGPRPSWCGLDLVVLG
jgi:hypothetical protein